MQLTKLILLVLALFFPPYLMGENFESLIANSPFVGQISSPAGGSKKKAASDIEINYELRGILIGNGIRIFNIYNPTNNKHKWVRQGDGHAQIVIDSFDERNKTLYFHTSDGKNFSVKLKNTLNDLNGLGIIIK